MDVSEIAWDAAGLVTVVVQDRLSGEVRMVAHANEEALEQTIESGYATFFSRSRGALWRKGETSGNTIAVSEVWADCDGDALLYIADPAGPSCHTGRRACFFRPLTAHPSPGEQAAPALVKLWTALEQRRSATAKESYTKSLLESGVLAIGDKLREESDELARAVADEPDERVISEAADVTYHLLVALLARGLTLRDVESVLAGRFGLSGHAEKAARPARVGS